jgi:hypothetical protein
MRAMLNFVVGKGAGVLPFYALSNVDVPPKDEICSANDT